jgi:beta propeller repeat protein
MYNIATNTEQAVYDDGDETWGQLYPSVDGNRVVWMDTRHGNYQIYRCDIGGVPERVYATTDNQWRPVISGDLVVWEEIDGSSNVTLIAYELGSDSVVLSYAISGVQANAAVSDGTIVWQEHNGSDHDIRGYDTTTAVYLDIATANQDDQNPAISGRRVVWQRNDADIVGAEIPLPTLLQVDAPATGQMLLAGFHAEIQWQLAEGTPPEWVDVEYSLNSGADWDSIDSNIPFTDAAYLWDPIPDANAIDSCQIRVSDTSGSAASGISGVFSIFQCDAELTADLTGDCFVDIKDLAEMAGQWLICGNPHDPTWCLP